MNEPVEESKKTDVEDMDMPTLRKRIDDIDDQVLELINRRLSFARAIGRIKESNGTAVVDSRREAQIFNRLLSLNNGPLKTGGLYRIFGNTIAAGRGVQYCASPAAVPPVYAIFGDPVGHSLSPVMHNSALAQTGLDGIYLAFRVKDIATAVSGIRGLGIRGASITIPHKVDVMPYLDEIDFMAEEIGAVNTIVNREGILQGHNSDCQGAVKALLEATPVKDRHVAIVGAGGGAQAIGFGIKREGARITIINRTRQRGEKLANGLACDFKLLAEVKKLSYDIVINATPVGMTPYDDQTPVKPQFLDPGTVVMDTVYNPLKTRFLTEADKVGCRTIDGVAMLVHQGAVQFELWTGQKAPVDIMRRAVLDELVE
jgi:shikimate dehydrogenase